MATEGQLLWQPSEAFCDQAQITRYTRWLEKQHGLRFDSYQALWQWSVDDLDAFWQSLWDYFELKSTTPYQQVLGNRSMPGARWFAGASINYAQTLLSKARPGVTAIRASSELRELTETSWDELTSQVRILATQMRALGVQAGDRVVSYMPSLPETVVAMLATTSIGAVWSSCSPDFGSKSALDRFQQIEPVLIFAVDGYRYGGRDFSRREEVDTLLAALPTLNNVIYLPYLNERAALPDHSGARYWRQLLDQPDPGQAHFNFAEVAFDHPLWIVFSSGTTGLPKAIVHGHGGVLIEALKSVHFHLNLSAGSHVFFYTSTGWIVWLGLVNTLLTGASITLYDGNPLQPDPTILWQIAARDRATFIGVSPPFVQLMNDRKIVPSALCDLSSLEGMFVTGSPMTPDHMAWCYENIRKDLWVGSNSGGTDIASVFVGSVPTLPAYAGEMQARALGVDVHAYNEYGEPVIDELGELICRQPIPSMPLYLWNDPENKRLIDTYFSTYPGVWRQGDFLKINQRGGCYIYGRSDSTLNRHGIRIGTSEIYRCVEALPQVLDSLVIDLPLADGSSAMLLFVLLADEQTLNEALASKIRNQLREGASPRHLPDEIFHIEQIPYTLTGKKLEVPVRKILSGVPIEKAASRDSMANPASLLYFVELAQRYQTAQPPTDTA